MTKFAVSFGSRLATHCLTVCSVTGVDPQGGVTNHLFDLESRLIFDCTQRLFRWQIFMRFCSERPVADMHRDNFIFSSPTSARRCQDYETLFHFWVQGWCLRLSTKDLPLRSNVPSFAVSLALRPTPSCFRPLICRVPLARVF